MRALLLLGRVEPSPPAVCAAHPPTRLVQLSLNQLTVAADGGMQVQAVGSPDRLGVAFGCTYPPSPKRTPLLGSGGGGGATDTGGSTTGSRPATAARDAVRQSGGSSLLAAALRLQGLGGRSVGLRGSGAAREGA